MRRSVWLLMLLGVLSILAFVPEGETQSADCTLSQGFVGVPYAFETITVSTTAIGLTATTYNPGGGIRPVMAFMTTATDTLRFRVDGQAPTSTIGHNVASGSSISICNSSFATWQAIKSGTSDVPLSVTYYKAPQ